MYNDFNQKGNRRKDAIYNPIEGKWEKRISTLDDEDFLSKIKNPLKLGDIKNVIGDLKKNAEGLSSKPLANSSLSTLKQITYKSLNRLKDIKNQQDLHDQKYSQVSEQEYNEDNKDSKKKDSNLLIIKIVIAAVMLLLALYK